MQIAAETEFADAQEYPAALTDYKKSTPTAAHAYTVNAAADAYCVAVTSKSGDTWVAASAAAGVGKGTCAAGVASITP